MNSMAENPSDSANEREYRRESKACFCLLAIVIFILMMIFNKDLCINSENGKPPVFGFHSIASAGSKF